MFPGYDTEARLVRSWMPVKLHVPPKRPFYKTPILKGEKHSGKSSKSGMKILPCFVRILWILNNIEVPYWQLSLGHWFLLGSCKRVIYFIFLSHCVFKIWKWHRKLRICILPRNTWTSTNMPTVDPLSSGGNWCDLMVMHALQYIPQSPPFSYG